MMSSKYSTIVTAASLSVILMLGMLPNLVQQKAYAIAVSPTTDANTLANAIIGPGITVVGTPTLVGIPDQQATFTGGAGSVGFDDGIALTSGDVNQVPGPNTAFAETLGSQNTGPADDISTDLGQAGDSDLDTLVGSSTFDANVLQFDFQFGDGSAGGDLAFNYAFASEEYINFVGSGFNDVFALFVDGQNIAELPDSTPVTINNVNPTSNSAFYVNNVENTDGFPVAGLDFHFDGRTTVLTAEALNLGPGTHTMKFAVADTSDGILDAAVFIQGGTFSVPDPCDDIDNNGNQIIDEGIVGVDDDEDGTIDEAGEACEPPTGITAEKFYTFTNIEVGPTLDETIIPDQLPTEDDVFQLKAVIDRKEIVKSYNPGQYYAFTVVDVTADTDFIRIVEDFEACVTGDYPVSTMNPKNVPGGAIVFTVNPDGTVTDLSSALAASGALFADEDFTSAEVTLEDVSEGTEIWFGVKFSPGLKGLEWTGPASCHNVEEVFTDPEAGVPGVVAEADLAVHE